MFKVLFAKTLRDFRAQIIGWGIGIGLLLILALIVYPSIASDYGDMVRQLPEAMRAFMGSESSFDSLEGYLNVEFMSYAPMVLAIFAILSGTTIIVVEEKMGTLDLILAHPVSRLRLFLVKFVGLVIANAMIVCILLTMFWLPIPFLDVEIKAGRVMIALTLLWPYLTTISMLSVLLSLLLSSRLFAGTVMAVLLVTSYVLDSLSNLMPVLESLRPALLTTYYQGRNALVAEVSWMYTVNLILILLATSGFSTWLFINRDIASHRPIISFQVFRTKIK